MRFVGSSARFSTEDIIKDVKRHSFYLKPGEKKRRVKQAIARKRARKKSRK